MAATIPTEFHDLFRKRSIASFATISPNGAPQVTPVWVDFDGSCILVNSAKGRRKWKNIRRDPRVALSILDPKDPYRQLEIRGRVIATVEEGAEEHIDQMARRYFGFDYPGRQPGEVRVIYKIAPEEVVTRVIPVTPDPEP